MTRRSVIVEARPTPLPIDPREVAVIVVDMQNDFGAEGGMFAPSESGFVSAALLAPSGSGMNVPIERSGAMWTWERKPITFRRVVV